MTYEDLNFSKLFKKVTTTPQEYTDADFDLLVRGISADKITEGISKSDALKVDYNQGQITRVEGAATRVELGKFTDGKFGMRVYDASGTVIVDSTA